MTEPPGPPDFSVVTPAGTGLASVPPEVRERVEAIWAEMQATGATEVIVTFTTARQRDEWLEFMRTYCQYRPERPLYFRLLYSRHLPELQQRIRITAAAGSLPH
jgi:hypothetical protein